jgi:hypothetical protein
VVGLKLVSRVPDFLVDGDLKNENVYYQSTCPKIHEFHWWSMGQLFGSCCLRGHHDQKGH